MMFALLYSDIISFCLRFYYAFFFGMRSAISDEECAENAETKI